MTRPVSFALMSVDNGIQGEAGQRLRQGERQDLADEDEHDGQQHGQQPAAGLSPGAGLLADDVKGGLPGSIGAPHAAAAGQEQQNGHRHQRVQPDPRRDEDKGHAGAEGQVALAHCQGSRPSLPVPRHAVSLHACSLFSAAGAVRFGSIIRSGRVVASRPADRPPRDSAMSDTPFLMTVQQHIMQEQRRRYPHASGEFSWLLSGITLATKIIESKVRRAGLVDVLGSAGRYQRPGRNAAEARRARQPGLALLPGQPRQRRHHGLGRERGAGHRRSRSQARQVRRDLRPARRVEQHRRQRQRRHHLLDPAPRGRSGGHARPAGRRVAARVEAGGRRLRRLRLVVHAGLHHRQRRPRLHARPGHRCLRHLPRAGHHADAGEPLLGQRGQQRRLSRGLSPLPGPAAGRRRRGTPTPRATSARWWPTSIARCSRAASSSIRRRRSIPAANCG